VVLGPPTSPPNEGWTPGPKKIGEWDLWLRALRAQRAPAIARNERAEAYREHRGRSAVGSFIDGDKHGAHDAPNVVGRTSTAARSARGEEMTLGGPQRRVTRSAHFKGDEGSCKTPMSSCTIE